MILPISDFDFKASGAYQVFSSINTLEERFVYKEERSEQNMQKWMF